MVRPDFYGATDECVRLSIEAKFERKFKLKPCCGITPSKRFKSLNEYFILCPICGKRTKIYKHLYEADQAWNGGETD